MSYCGVLPPTAAALLPGSTSITTISPSCSSKDIPRGGTIVACTTRVEALATSNLGLADNARHVMRCPMTQETRV